MVWRIFFGNESEPEDQGGFCDTGSQIHYCNDSKEDTLDQAARFEEYGSSDIRTEDNRDPSDCSDSTRFNTTILEADDQGFEYPARHDPGR